MDIHKKPKLIPIILLLLLTVNVALAVIYSNYHISSVGTVKTINVEVYWDFYLTNPVTQIDWDTVAPVGYTEPGTTKTVIIYVVSISNSPMTLNMYTGTWTPVGIDLYMSCTWDAQGIVLSPDTPLQTAITLQVEQGIIEAGYETFNFEIVLEGSG